VSKNTRSFHRLTSDRREPGKIVDRKPTFGQFQIERAEHAVTTRAQNELPPEFSLEAREQRKALALAQNELPRFSPGFTCKERL